jgi:hypothetical protein
MSSLASEVSRIVIISPLGFDGLYRINDFMEKMKSNSVFPVSTVSYKVEQSKRYTHY